MTVQLGVAAAAAALSRLLYSAMKKVTVVVIVKVEADAVTGRASPEKAEPETMEGRTWKTGFEKGLRTPSLANFCSLDLHFVAIST